MSARRLGLFIIPLAVLGATPARAASPDDVKRAQVLFDEGLSLMRASKFPEACPKLAESERLDPGMGTRYRLAECYEAEGKLASSWALFLRVAEEAKREQRADREEQSRQRADALRPRLPGVTIILAEPGEDLAVTLDGIPVARADLGTRIPLDPGAHVVLVKSARRETPFQRDFTVKEAESYDLKVPPPPPERPKAPPPPPPAPAPPPAPQGPSPVRVAGLVVGGVGLAAVGVGLGLGGAAKSSWDAALAGCQGGDPSRCTASAVAQGQSADTLATTATVLTIAGGALLVGGVVAAIVAPSPKARASQALGAAPPQARPRGRARFHPPSLGFSPHGALLTLRGEL